MARCGRAGNERADKMKIVAEEAYPGQWWAVDDDTYDGPGSLIGRGNTKQEAIADLKEQIAEKE